MPPTQKQCNEMAAFAMNGRQTCKKKECKDSACWDDKNHHGFKPLPKHKGILAVASSDVPQNYGECQPCGPYEFYYDEDACPQDDEYTKVAGTFVASVAQEPAKIEISNQFVPPSTFEEALSDDDG